MNVLNAITNVVKNPVNRIVSNYSGNNRANNAGDALEEYVKDIFAGTLHEQDDSQRLRKISEIFSYLGNKNNPPDSILKGGDAIEVKKIESRGSALALNSSYPKAKIFADSPMITTACRNCENWTVKDIIYVVGVVNSQIMSSLCFVYGEDYAGEAEIYERVKTAIKNGILEINDIEFAETKELGKVRKVDPLGITDLRIRGMWHIENPLKTFNYVYIPEENKQFNFMAIINTEKYKSFPDEDRKNLENLENEVENFKIEDVEIKNPNNPAKLKKVKLITFFMD